MAGILRFAGDFPFTNVLVWMCFTQQYQWLSLTFQCALTLSMADTSPFTTEENLIASVWVNKKV
jgi:hypothetical protein